MALPQVLVCVFGQGWGVDPTLPLPAASGSGRPLHWSDGTPVSASACTQPS